jgi:tetratricopeptide (TPR) repeat protein
MARTPGPAGRLGARGGYGTMLVAQRGMKYMTRLLGLMFLLPVAPFIPGAHAQTPYEDLLILYVDEEYEKCLGRAERYTQREKTKRDPLPYLYLSMCSFEMSQLEAYTTQPEYKWVERDALKYAMRFRKKDKNNEFFPGYDEYFSRLNTVAMESALVHFELEEYSKARRIFQRMTRYHPENPGAWHMLALCQIRSNQQRDAEVSLRHYREALDQVPDISRMPKDEGRLLKYAMLRHVDLLEPKGMLDSARTVLNMAVDHFMDDPEFSAVYEDLN